MSSGRSATLPSPDSARLAPSRPPLAPRRRPRAGSVLVRLVGGVLNALLLALPCLLLSESAALLDSGPAVLLLLALTVVFVAELKPGADDLDPTTPTEARLALLTGLLLLAVCATALTDGVLRAAPLGAGAVAGLGLILGGAHLRRRAIHGLGEHFNSGEYPAAGLRCDGVHRVVRHPSELGLLMIAAGAPALMASPWAALPALLLLGLVLYRVRREDRALEATYGAAWRAYREAVGGLLPRFNPRS